MCDESHGPLIQRDDDSEQVIRKRLEEYHRRTQQVLDYYRQRGLVRPVAGQQPAEQVTADIVGEIESARAQR
jgi:adenylate kinase